MKLTDEQKEELQERINFLEAESAHYARILARLQIQAEELKGLIEPPNTNGHKSTTDPEAFGINPYKTYSTKQVLAIFKGDTVEWRQKLNSARKSGKLKYELKGRGIYYTGEALIKWRQGTEKGK